MTRLNQHEFYNSDDGSKCVACQLEYRLANAWKTSCPKFKMPKPKEPIIPAPYLVICPQVDRPRDQQFAEALVQLGQQLSDALLVRLMCTQVDRP